ncbi:Methylated-DNA--protein-cysteine methyltransferase, partial [Trachymyrmex septentrionalis]
EYKSNYMTFRLLYAFHRTPIGKCLIAVTDTDEFNEFQIKIWKSLTGVPRGTITTYEEVAWMVGCDSKIAIVGNACSRNYITYIVPCHCVMP